MRRFLKILFFIFLVVFLLISLLLVSTQTRFFKNWLRDFIVEKGNENINGELRINRIDGNLFSHLEVSDIIISSHQDTVIHLPKFILELSPTRLFEGEIFVDSILIDKLYLKVNQEKDSTWNIINLAKPDTSALEDTTEISESSGLPDIEFYLPNFYLRDAKIKMRALNKIIPQMIKDINIRFSVGYAFDQQQFRLSECRLQTLDPDFQLQEISFFINGNEEAVTLQDFIIKTGKNKIDAQGIYSEDIEQQSIGEMESEPIHFEEFQVFMPQIAIGINPQFSLNVDYHQDDLICKINIFEQNKGVFLEAKTSNLGKIMDKSSRGQIQYGLNGKIQNIDIGYWMNDPTMDYLINGEFQLNGSGMTTEDADVSIKADFSDCIVLGKPVSDITLAAKYEEGDVQSDLKILSDFCEVLLNAKLRDLSNSQKYSAQLNITNLDIGSLMQNDSMHTDINLDLSAQGEGFDPETMKGNVKLNISSTKFLNFTLDTLISSIQFANQNFIIDSFNLNSNLLLLDIDGNFSLESESNIQFLAQLNNLMAMNSFAKADTLQADGFLSGNFKGKMDSLFAETKFKLDKIIFNANTIDSISGKVSSFIGKDHIDGTADIHVTKAGVNNFVIQDIHLKSDFTQSLINILLDVNQGDLFSTHLKSKVKLDSFISVFIPEISIDVKEQKWQGGSEDMEIVIDESGYFIKNFRLASTSHLSGHEQLINANGNISLIGDEDFELIISGIDLGSINEIFDLPMSLGGIFNMNVSLKGDAEEPAITGEITLSDGKLNNYEYKTLRGNINYLNELLNWKFILIPLESDSIVLNGELPLHISLTDSIRVIEDEPLYVQLKSDRYPLSAIKTGNFKVENVKGFIDCNLQISGTMKEPVPDGFFRINNGAFKIPQYGVDYENLELGFSLKKSGLTLDKFRVRREEGYLTLSGQADFDSSLFSGNLKNFQFDLDAKDFFLVKHKHYELQFSATTFLNGNMESPKFGGNITIPRSNLFLPALTGSEQTNKPPEASLPRLIVERNKLIEESNIQNQTKVINPHKEKSSSDVYKNLRGQLRISIPKNTWIKSPDMRMELSGEVDLVKEETDFKVFGPVRINRGHYDLFGRRFTIKEGSVNFKGGTEINPDIKLEAEYVFRTSAREKKYLRLYVSGNVKAPVLNFTLDDTEISEGDAVSYIIFGRSIDELTSGQRDDVSGGSEGIGVAGNLAANLLSSELTKAIGGQFNLDYIEVKSEDNWESASFVVGKYLTNDLFVSYERLFGQSQSDDTAKELVTAEYELTHFLFFQLMGGQAKHNGFDVIFKFNKQ